MTTAAANRSQPSGSSAVPQPTNGLAKCDTAHAESLLTKEQVRVLLGLPSTRGVDELVRRRAIPIVVLGHRTRRFSWPAVLHAIEKLTIRSI